MPLSGDLRLITTKTVTELLDAGARAGAKVIGRPEGKWAVMIQVGNRESVLVAQRSRQVREFARIETAATALRELGIVRFEVDGTEYRQTDTASASRRATAARQKMREVHARAAHDQWVRERVEASLADARPSLSNEEATARFTVLREQIRQAG